MAIAGDFFRTRFLVNVDGVQCLSSMTWKLITVKGGDSTFTNLLALSNAWFDSIKAIISTDCVFGCADFYNYSQPEQVSVYPALAGIGVGDAHPQFQVVRFNTYGHDQSAPATPVRRGATNLSGVLESLSTRGRINDPAEFEDYRQFQFFPLDLGVAGWDVEPQLRYVSVPGNPPTYDFVPMVMCDVNPTFLTLRGRKTNACTI